MSIPPAFYIQSLKEDSKGYKCLILIEQNKEDASWMDPIDTEVDGYDYKTNNGYILGAPVLQSMMLLFNFEKNTVGIAQKVHAYGARLHDSSSPSDEPSDGSGDDGDSTGIDDDG